MKLQATIEESIAADLSLICEWSNNEKNYVVNELLRFAVAEDSEFQAYKQSLASARPEPREAGPTPSVGSPEYIAKQQPHDHDRTKFWRAPVGVGA